MNDDDRQPAMSILMGIGKLTRNGQRRTSQHVADILTSSRQTHTEKCPCVYCVTFRFVEDRDPQAAYHLADALWPILTDETWEDAKDRLLDLDFTMMEPAARPPIFKHTGTGSRVYLARYPGTCHWHFRCTDYNPLDAPEDKEWVTAFELAHRYPDGDLPPGEVWTEDPAHGPRRTPRAVLAWHSPSEHESPDLQITYANGQGGTQSRYVTAQYNNLYITAQANP